MPYRSRHLVSVLLVAAASIIHPVLVHAEFLRIRALDASVADLLAVGYTASPTLRSLVDRLQKSDLVVHIESRATHTAEVDGTLQFVVRAGQHRYVRITVHIPTSTESAIALLAHELRHAVEVADDASVVDVPTFEALYRRIGHERRSASGTISFDTRAAGDVGRRVIAELRGTTTRVVAHR